MAVSENPRPCGDLVAVRRLPARSPPYRFPRHLRKRKMPQGLFSSFWADSARLRALRAQLGSARRAARSYFVRLGSRFGSVALVCRAGLDQVGLKICLSWVCSGPFGDARRHQKKLKKTRAPSSHGGFIRRTSLYCGREFSLLQE